MDAVEAGGYKVPAGETSVQLKAGISATIRAMYPQRALRLPDTAAPAAATTQSTLDPRGALGHACIHYHQVQGATARSGYRGTRRRGWGCSGPCGGGGLEPVG